MVETIISLAVPLILISCQTMPLKNWTSDDLVIADQASLASNETETLFTLAGQNRTTKRRFPPGIVDLRKVINLYDSAGSPFGNGDGGHRGIFRDAFLA